MDPSWRASGQEAAVAIAELMETFRDMEQSCPGLCDTFLQKIVMYFKTELAHLSPRTLPITQSTSAKSPLA